MVKDYIWTNDSVAELSTDMLRIIRERAIAKGKEETVLLFDAEIARRSPPKKLSATSNRGQPVRGFHFVCKRDRGVVYNPDGTFWSGSWVVAVQQAERGEKNNAYVALHEKKSEPSYLQGIIKGWRTAPRDRQYSDAEVQTDEGIEFLLAPIPESLIWRGEATGEKGYWYGDNEPSPE